MKWYFALVVPLAWFLWKSWHSTYERDRFKWHGLSQLTLSLYAGAVFYDGVPASSPLWLAFLPMLALALMTGVVGGFNLARWRRTPPGPELQVVGTQCALCDEQIPAREPGLPPVREMLHHLRLFHPDQYEELATRIDSCRDM